MRIPYKRISSRQICNLAKLGRWGLQISSERGMEGIGDANPLGSGMRIPYKRVRSSRICNPASLGRRGLQIPYERGTGGIGDANPL
jgi:hypothetical protein